MIVTRINLVGANNKTRVITFGGGIEDARAFIKESEYSDYSVLNWEKINLGECKFTTEKETKYQSILSDIAKDLDDYVNYNGAGMMDDVKWGDLFIERVTASIESFQK